MGAPDQLLMRRERLDDLPPLPACAPGYELRAYRAGEDDEILARLLRLAFADTAWVPERARGVFVDDATVKGTVLITTRGTAAATASARQLPAFPGSGYVHWVATDPFHTGKRLGWIASLAVLHEFVALGCRDAVLETDDHRLPALKTYLGLGFRPVERGPGHAERWRRIQERLAEAST
jgi:mycothiol synthase